MAMTFISREHLENFESAGHGLISTSSSYSSSVSRSRTARTIFVGDKLSIPRSNGYVQRPRLDRLLSRSLDQSGAILVTGRAGTGKTALVANFAKKYPKTAWYRIEAADSEWKVFSGYLFTGLNQDLPPIDEKSVITFVEKLLLHSQETSLIVLDDIHNVFDTPWFSDFFLTLLYSLSPETHLICLSRSLPSLPIWRLRSKQTLSMVDENMLAFNLSEIDEFCRLRGVGNADAKQLYEESFGRIGKLRALSEMADEIMIEKTALL
jgi:LuxR family maltose regulon positive regulatory protein